MQVVEQEQADDTTGEAVGHGRRTRVNHTVTSSELVADSDTAATARARNVGSPLAVRFAYSDRIGACVADRIRITHEP